MWKILSVVATIGSIVFGAIGVVVDTHDAKEKISSLKSDDNK